MRRLTQLHLKKMFGYFILVLFLLSTSGCKIHYTLTGAAVGAAKTFSVDYIQNMAELVYPPLSQNITSALKDRFIADTNLQLVREEGDLHFVGEITEYQNEAVTATATEEAGSFKLTVTVKVNSTKVLLDLEPIPTATSLQ
jgi:hypothetical protein